MFSPAAVSAQLSSLSSTALSAATTSAPPTLWPLITSSSDCYGAHHPCRNATCDLNRAPRQLAFPQEEGIYTKVADGNSVPSTIAKQGTTVRPAARLLSLGSYLGSVWCLPLCTTCSKSLWHHRLALDPSRIWWHPRMQRPPSHYQHKGQ